MTFWILDGHIPVEADLETWGEWMETANRHVGLTPTKHHRVSTVFLGTNHNWGEGPPVLFETMVFDEDGTDVVECLRWYTWDDAEAGHAATVERVERDEARDKS